MTRAKTVVTIVSYSVNTLLALTANPRAMAPLIMPAYERKRSSLNVRVCSA